MIEYIYFVKCPNCEDEHFYFFNDAKECAMNRLSQKPVITQTEVNRNDFGECTDHCDLGTVWSWEDMMNDVSTDPEQTAFSKADTIECDNCFDQEFDELDNSLEEDVKDTELEYKFEPTELEKAQAEVFKLNGAQRFKKDETLPQIYALYRELAGEPDGSAISRDGRDFLYFYEKFQELKQRREIEINPFLDDSERRSRAQAIAPGSSTPSPKGASSVKFKSKTAKDTLTQIAESIHTISERKPVPADMTIESLVEEMEENEDDVECRRCEELFDKSECKYDKDYHGWLCWHCQQAVLDHGGDLRISDAPIDEAYSKDPRDQVELEYPELTVTLYSSKHDVDDWDEVEHTDSHVYLVPKVEVATAIWENWITEEDAVDVDGGLEALEDNTAWEKFLETHFDGLFEKYHAQILEYFKEEATEDFRERSQEEYQMDRLSSNIDRAYDEWHDERLFNESAQKPFLEEFDDAETHKASLTDCPECGTVSYDMKEQYCINCGLNL